MFGLYLFLERIHDFVQYRSPHIYEKTSYFAKYLLR